MFSETLSALVSPKPLRADSDVQGESYEQCLERMRSEFTTAQQRRHANAVQVPPPSDTAVRP